MHAVPIVLMRISRSVHVSSARNPGAQTESRRATKVVLHRSSCPRRQVLWRCQTARRWRNDVPRRRYLEHAMCMYHIWPYITLEWEFIQGLAYKQRTRAITRLNCGNTSTLRNMPLHGNDSWKSTSSLITLMYSIASQMHYIPSFAGQIAS